MPTPYAEHHQHVSAIFRTLAAPLRLAIVELLVAHHRLHVHEIVALTGASQPLASQHLRILRQARLVDRVPAGHAVVYRLAQPEIASLLTAAARCTGDPT
ncbi:metalloregulator ArsR/SmtB family transcription factor [Dactylosporangium sp. NPDC005572]|uniref:ArsR/SmtB family transcription factor n=1 Tax=Dactylosporangium sp. NPDC005572 TaxID=3156889 RepID=UPI0033AB35FD